MFCNFSFFIYLHTTPQAAELKYLSCLNKGYLFKSATHLAILYADRRDRRKSPGVPGAAIAIFAVRRDRRIKSPISGMSDIGD